MSNDGQIRLSEGLARALKLHNILILMILFWQKGYSCKVRRCPMMGTAISFHILLRFARAVLGEAMWWYFWK